MAENHDCENCKYFLRHYIIKNGRLIEVNCGQCGNINLPLKFTRKQVFKENCPFKEINTNKEEKNEKLIKDLLGYVQRDLARIVRLLEYS